jgi:hypothetical protein
MRYSPIVNARHPVAYYGRTGSLLILRRGEQYDSALFTLPEVADAVEEDSQDDRATDESALPEGVDAEETEAVADDFDEGGADQGAEGGAGAAGKVGAADDGGGDDLQFHAGADIGGDGAQPAGPDDAGDPGGQRRNHVDDDLDPSHRHTGQRRRVLIAADGEDIAAEARPPQHTRRAALRPPALRAPSRMPASPLTRLS